MRHNELLKEKVIESLSSVLPITVIVLIVSISIAPLSPGVFMLFLFGAVMLVLGMGLFTLGVDMSMMPMGEGIGIQMSRSKKIWISLAVCFVLGVLITIAEPDLQVLANQVSAVMNGTVRGSSEHSGALISAVGSDVALSGLTVTDVMDAVWIADQTAKENDSRVTITDCVIRCHDSGVFIKGNGTVTEKRTYLHIENTEIYSDGNYGVVGNGAVLPAGNFGTDITIRNSKLDALYAGIYHPQPESYLLVENCTIKGLTPIVIKGGTATIHDTNVEAYNGAQFESMIEQPTLAKSGFSNTGAGLYVETGYDYICAVTVSGNTRITSHYNDAVLMYKEDNSRYSVSVTGGSYSHDVSAFTAEGYSCTGGDDGRYTVTEN